ncbi:MAG TPA: RNase adapter RapZ [Elusimicrobiota bacterium]|nr:RNase adapter RapZ [Elusimicrobiota bacterium]
MEAELRRLYEQRFGRAPASFAALAGDASARKLFRLGRGAKTAIGVYGPDRDENRAFLGFSRHFHACGLPVPEIYAVDEVAGVYLEEDLGDTTLFKFLSARRGPRGFSKEVRAAYRETVRWLPRFQIKAGKTLDYSLCYPRASFDRQSMLWDLSHFKYYFLKMGRVAFGEQALEDDFRRFVAILLSAPRDFFLYRDFQSRNVMLRGGRPHFIDYQGGRKGALQYDVASLLWDAKADLPADLQEELLELYLGEASKLVRLDRREFRRLYPAFVLVRILQALGTYGLRGFHERKEHFLQSIPFAMRNLERLIGAGGLPPGLPELEAVIRRMVASASLRKFGKASLSLTVRIMSFSYKHGMPVDDHGHGGGFVFDCRALPNPGRHVRFARLTGKDPSVAAYLRRQPEVGSFLRSASALVGRTVETYRARNFTDLMVAFGCTGGQHRSVYCAEMLAKRLRERHGVQVEVHHREQEGAA